MPTYGADLIPDTNGRTLGSSPQRWNGLLQLLDVSQGLTLGNGARSILWGIGDPVAANGGLGTAAPQGSIYLREDGDASTTFYVKTGTANTAWTSYGVISSGTITSDLIGNVTGNVNGDVLGNVTGNVIGNVTGNLNGAVTLLSPLETSQGGTGQNSTATFPTSGVVVTEAGTENLKNKTLVLASSGNSISLVNQQGAISALTGNATDQTVFTYTLSANVMGAGKGLRILFGYNHSTGSASVSYKIWLGTSTIASWSSSSAGANYSEVMVFNNAGLTNAQNAFSKGAGVGPSTSAIDMTLNQTIKATFNVAATDQVTGTFWMIEAIQ